jgi:hypothetical protein
VSVRFKPVPAPPAERSVLGAAQAALPLVPKGEVDCCRRLQGRVEGIGGRDVARRWLTFLRALGLATRVDGRFTRTERDADDEAVAAAFRDRVFGAREVLAALEGGELDADGAFEAVAPAVPAWERERHGDWTAVYRERAARLLDWAVVLGLARRSGDRYHPVSRPGTPP